MSSELTPQAALATAGALREAASAGRVPAWFPALAATTHTTAMTLTGTSWLIHGSAGTVLGLTGAALIVVNLALFPLLVRLWRRAGVVPRTDGLYGTRRWSTFQLAIACVVIAAAVWAASGQIGWAIIVFGILTGAENWHRLTGWRRR